MSHYAVCTRESVKDCADRGVLRDKWRIFKWLKPSAEHELVTVEFEVSRLQMKHAGFRFIDPEKLYADSV